MKLRAIIILSMLFPSREILAQPEWPILPNGRFLNPSDMTIPYDHIDFKGELYNFEQGNTWKFSLAGGISLFRDKHELTIELPVVRSEYTDIENLTGIGDIMIRWKILTYESIQRVRTLASSAFYFEVSLPTGEELNGHGAGVPVITPGFILAYRPVPQIGILPHLRYAHSLGEANSEWSGGMSGTYPGNPDDMETKIRALQAEIFFYAEFSQAWLGLAPGYIYDFYSGEGTLNLRPEIGKLFADSLALKLSGLFYIAGRRRLLNWTMFSVNYFF
ncbi:MAG: hypothetical protein KFF73_09620 [Cyclobacteriaceae bacterium]|nr:hypothetical protein [Cyclobacteriaceae bacterium]